MDAADGCDETEIADCSARCWSRLGSSWAGPDLMVIGGMMASESAPSSTEVSMPEQAQPKLLNCRTRVEPCKVEMKQANSSKDQPNQGIRITGAFITVSVG